MKFNYQGWIKRSHARCCKNLPKYTISIDCCCVIPHAWYVTALISVIGSGIEYWDLKFAFCDRLLGYKIWVLWSDTGIWILGFAIYNKLV